MKIPSFMTKLRAAHRKAMKVPGVKYISLRQYARETNQFVELDNAHISASPGRKNRGSWKAMRKPKTKQGKQKKKTEE